MHMFILILSSFGVIILSFCRLETIFFFFILCWPENSACFF